MKHNQQNHNYIRNRKNTARNSVVAKEESIRRMGANRVKREEKYGKYAKLIIAAEHDRINGELPQVFEEESMQLSYFYGYYERGSRVLVGKFETGIYSEEEQRKFGMNDFLYGVPEKFLKSLKKYNSYREGRIYQMGVSSYDFIVEKGITVDEYIKVIGLVCPEVKEKQFIEGYLSRLEMKKKILEKESR